MTNKILVTGGAGFIGSAVVRYLIEETDNQVLNLDKLTYAGNLESLTCVAGHPRYQFMQTDICDAVAVKQCFESYHPDIVMHLAAESHVDRSIVDPAAFIQTNIVGTYVLLEACRQYVNQYPYNKSKFRFHHISTDEVYGDLGDNGLFVETTPYAPNSPYAASKASSDHLVRAWGRTYGIPYIITNCSNNYGPYHFPEKLIPLAILNALNGMPLPLYGDGKQVRDWLFVEDHARALVLVATNGENGETYNIGGFSEKTNIDVVRTICQLLNQKITDKPKGVVDFSNLITFVEDRPGHDLRYSIDATKIKRELGWFPDESFESGMAKTVDWFIANQDWCKRVLEG